MKLCKRMIDFVHTELFPLRLIGKDMADAKSKTNNN